MVFLALPLVILHFDELSMMFIGFLGSKPCCRVAAASAVVGLRHDGVKNKKQHGGLGEALRVGSV